LVAWNGNHDNLAHPILFFPMKLEVTLSPSANTYSWKLFDGPDGIDEFAGQANSLGGAFEQVQTRRVLNALRYKTKANQVLASTVKQPIHANKTVHD